MRSYLLGTLDEAAKQSVEERYFTDRAYFLRMKWIESELIRDYLTGRLDPDRKRIFEERYCKIPDMRRHLENLLRICLFD